MTDRDVFEKIRRIQEYLTPLALETTDDEAIAEKLWPAVWALAEAAVILVKRAEVTHGES
jgi:hypothetical protein